jgi:hypothetical protein
MKIYKKQNEVGCFWFRSKNGNILKGGEILKTIKNKYETLSPQFYLELSLNKIKTLDVLDDFIVLETNSGFIVESFLFEDDIFTLKSNLNNCKLYNYFGSFDYWYNESDKNVFTLYFQPSSDFNFHIEFDKWSNSDKIPIINDYFETGLTQIPEKINPIKITFNQETKNFNATTIFKKDENSNFSVFSFNFNSNGNISKANIMNGNFESNV